MEVLLTITDPRRLTALNDLIHDGWFDTSAVTLDRSTSTLRVPFEREASERASVVGGNRIVKKLRVPVDDCALTIRHVRDYVLKESENIGRYDFNVLEYDALERQIVISTGIPLNFKVWVEALSISVEVMAQDVSEKIVRVWF